MTVSECINHWPAMTKWTDVQYLLKVAGERTVPVEVGSHYADENWSQKLMTIRDFIRNYYLEDTTDLGYLAQHNLFDQVCIYFKGTFLKSTINHSIHTTKPLTDQQKGSYSSFPLTSYFLFYQHHSCNSHNFTFPLYQLDICWFHTS